jgi:hypothetical protein
MAANPAFAATPRNGVVQISTANLNRDGSGTVGTVFTAGANGSRIDKVTAKAQTATAVAGMIRLFIHNGSAFFLAYEMTVDVVAPSASVAAWTETAPVVESGGTNDVFPMILPNGYSLRASTEKGDTFNIIAQGGDF